MRRIWWLLALFSTFIVALPTQAATVSPPTVTFPDTPVGATSTPQTIHAQLGLSEFSDVTLSDPVNFSIDLSTTTCLPVTTGTCDVTIVFTPTSPGPHTATVDIGETFAGHSCKPPGQLGPPCIIPPSTKATVPLSGNGLDLPPALPETPLVALFPLVGIAIGTGSWLIPRRRARRAET